MTNTVKQKKNKKEGLTPCQKARRKEFTSRFFYKNRFHFAVFLFCSFTDVLLSAGMAWLLQIVTDIAAGESNMKFITVVYILLGTIASVIFFGMIHRYSKNLALKRGMVNYKEYAFSKLTEKNIASFQNEQTSKYISALTNDVNAIEEGYLSGTVNIVMQVIQLVIALTMMFAYDWLLALVSIAVAIMPVAISLLYGNSLTEVEKKVSDRNAGFIAAVKDILSGYTVIKNFKAEPQIKKMFNAENEALEDVKCQRRRTVDLIDVIMSCASLLLQIGVFIFGAYIALYTDRITVGVIIAFIQLTGVSLGPIQKLPSLIASKKASKALIDKTAEAIYENGTHYGTEHISDIGNGIEIKGLKFGYEPGKPVLNDINFTFEKGKSYALVGGSGSGKTTLLSLMLGYYDRYEGNITVGGKELRNIAPESLYGLTSIIQQSVFIFDSSIINNITMFRSFPEEAVKSAVRRSGLTALIEAHGDDYRCGESGSALSGGERQRISIARALLSNTPVMFMDEATAALDNETAFTVTSAILDIEDMTRIVVTHRLEEALLRRYDKILVLRSGKIEQSGTFDELMSHEGYFKSLYEVSK